MEIVMVVEKRSPSSQDCNRVTQYHTEVGTETTYIHACVHLMETVNLQDEPLEANILNGDVYYINRTLGGLECA